MINAILNCKTAERLNQRIFIKLRGQVSSKSAIPTGKIKIEVETKYDTKERLAPATLTLRVNGKEVGQGRIGRSVPAVHTASETFDIGADLNSPVSLDYFDRAPFRFNGKIEKINIRYKDNYEKVNFREFYNCSFSRFSTPYKYCR